MRDRPCIGHLHDDVILLPRPESFRILFCCANNGFCYLNLAGINEFKYERKNEKDSGHGSKMTPSCKWTIVFGNSDCLDHLTISKKSEIGNGRYVLSDSLFRFGLFYIIIIIIRDPYKSRLRRTY